VTASRTLSVRRSSKIRDLSFQNPWFGRSISSIDRAIAACSDDVPWNGTVTSAAAFFGSVRCGHPAEVPAVVHCVRGALRLPDIAPFKTSFDLERRRDLERGGFVMDAKFKDRWILVVEDQPLVALAIANRFSQAGASVLSAGTLQEGLRLAEHPHLSAAILDLALGEHDCVPLCIRLSDRHIPFVIYTGYSEVPAACRAGVIVPKPATPDTLLGALAQLLAR
jgi:CheY-like chemotaxis protein